jgi:hypothetical protein
MPFAHIHAYYVLKAAACARRKYRCEAAAFGRLAWLYEALI